MTKGTLYTSYFANVKKGIGIKVSVAAYTPKWLNSNDIDWCLRYIPPPKDLLIKYKKGDMKFEEYMISYQKYLNSNDININNDISYLIHLLEMGCDVTIYCYERNHLTCHRNIIRNKMKSLGYNVIEIQPDLKNNSR